jgi:hypothetical protein
MSINYVQSVTVAGMIVAAMLLAAAYLRWITIERPPIGLFTTADIIVISGMVVITQLIYALVPGPTISAVFGLLFFVILQTVLTPLTGGIRALILAALLMAADIAPAIAGNLFAATAVNDLLIIGAVVGVSNMWTQTGLRAGHLAGFAAMLALYDYLTTTVLPLNGTIFSKLGGLPFAPMLAFPGGGRAATAIGLGDCLIVTVWPLVLARSYGRRAAWAGGAVCLIGLAAVDVSFAAGWFPNALVPVLTFLGPAIVIQFAVLRRLAGAGKRTHQWRGVPRVQAVRSSASAADVISALAAAAAGDHRLPTTWVACLAGRIVAEGATPGAARKAARLADHSDVPIVVRTTMPRP